MINYEELRDKIFKLVEEIHKEDPYRCAHIKAASGYAKHILQMILEEDNDEKRHEILTKMECVAVAHDILKEKHFDPNSEDKNINGYIIPQNLTAYIQKNMDVLRKYKMGRYINTAVQDHAIASAIFIHNNFGITDPMIIYPIMFHSCPILPIYQKLDKIIQDMIDAMVLSDKLSASIVKPLFNRKAKIDLKAILFGPSGHEFNYSQALLMARLIGHNNSNDAHSTMMTEYYHERILKTNPFMPPEGKLPIVKDGKIQKLRTKKKDSTAKPKNDKGKKKKDVKKKNGKKGNRPQ